MPAASHDSNDLPDADAGIVAKIKRMESLTKSLALQRSHLHQTRDRFIIGISVVLFFLLTIMALVSFVLVESNWTSKAEFRATILSSILLPVVTLVLGYYFGSEKISDPS